MFSPPIPMLFPVFGLICAKQNFSIQCKLGRNCVIRWPFGDWKWRKHEPTDGSRAICKDFSRQYEVEFLSLKREPTFPQTFSSFPSNVSRNKTHYLGNPFPVIFLLNSGKFLMKTIFGGYMNSKSTEKRTGAPIKYPRKYPRKYPSSAGVPNLPLSREIPVGNKKERYPLG